MKALIIKDFIWFWKQGRIYIASIALFAVAFFFLPNNALAGYYPSLILGMIATTFFQIDEREKWNVYIQTMPCTKKEYVVSKYIVSLLFAFMGTVIMAASSLASSIVNGNFDIKLLISYIGMMFLIGIAPSSLMLLFMFKFASEKGRIICLAVFGLSFAAVGVFAAKGIITDSGALAPKLNFFISVFCAIVIWAASLLLSVKIYDKKEVA